MVVSYEVTWTSDGDDIEPVIITGDRTDYTITGLNEGSTYSITVTPINDAGRGESLTFTISTTSAAGIYTYLPTYSTMIHCHSSYSCILQYYSDFRGSRRWCIVGCSSSHYINHTTVCMLQVILNNM